MIVLGCLLTKKILGSSLLKIAPSNPTTNDMIIGLNVGDAFD